MVKGPATDRCRALEQAQRLSLAATPIVLFSNPRSTPASFQTLLFPERLTPDYADDPRAIAIAEADRRHVELRDRWLNPPEWVESVDEADRGPFDTLRAG